MIWLRSGAISLDGYDSKMRKLSRCIPTVSNGTIPATKQEFFFTNVASVQSITDAALFGFWLILLPWMFTLSCLHYHLLFLIKIFFSNVYISVNTIFEYSYLFFVWEVSHPSGTSATGGMKGGHPKCVEVRTGGEGYHVLCVSTYSLFMLLSYGVLFYL